MSLQQAASVTQAAIAFANLWTHWLNPPGGLAYVAPGGGVGAAARGMSRKAMMRTAITQFTSFLPPLALSFPNLGQDTLGGLNWTNWTLQINNAFFLRDSITYTDFIELCRTAYHESRHGEQVYRAAQGLAALAFPFPDTSQATVIQAASSGAGGVAARVAAFSGQGLQQPAVRVQLITKLLKIPSNVAQHAETNRLQFATFVALPKPVWFKRQTVTLEVQEWMRSLAKQSLNGMTMWVEQNAGEGRRAYAMYRDLPVELDAHAIEDSVATALETRIGRTEAVDGNRQRTDTARFGP